MAYEILRVLKQDSKILVVVEFNPGRKGSIEFESGVTKDEILAKLDSMDTDFKAKETDEKSGLSAELKTLTGYKKA